MQTGEYNIAATLADSHCIRYKGRLFIASCHRDPADENDRHPFCRTPRYQ